MADATYQPKVYRDSGGDRWNAVSGATVNIESGATETHANNPTFSGNPAFTGTPDFSGASGVTMKASSVTAASLGANLKTGFIPLDITSARIIATNDIGVKGATDGGTVSKDTAPILERINAATDKALRLTWAASGVEEIQLPSFAYPPDLDDTANVEVHLLVYKNGNTDTGAVIAVGYFEGIGDSNAGGNTAAITEIVAAEKTVIITAANIGTHPNVGTVTLTPGAHGTDAIYLLAAWVEYTRKT